MYSVAGANVDTWVTSCKAATVFGCFWAVDDPFFSENLLAQATSSTERVLYESADGKPLGQLAVRCSWKKRQHLKHLLLSRRSDHSSGVSAGSRRLCAAAGLVFWEVCEEDVWVFCRFAWWSSSERSSRCHLSSCLRLASSFSKAFIQSVSEARTAGAMSIARRQRSKSTFASKVSQRRSSGRWEVVPYRT